MLSAKAEAARQAVPLFNEQSDFRRAIRNLPRTAMRNLATAAAAAEVFEELEVLLKYQAARQIIPHEFSRLLLTELQKIARKHQEDDDRRRAVTTAFMGHVVRLHCVVEKENKR